MGKVKIKERDYFFLVQDRSELVIQKYENGRLKDRVRELIDENYKLKQTIENLENIIKQDEKDFDEIYKE